jgi:catechol 2,3-dioxygenase-like lactoylglutathione lyase family enzyme
VYESLDFLYVPVADVDEALRRYVDVFGAELGWKVRAMGTTVACVRVAGAGPDILLTDHLEGSVPILIYRVADYDTAVEALRAGGVDDLRELEIPHGPCASFQMAGGQRFAVYQLVRPEAASHFEGRIDP